MPVAKIISGGIVMGSKELSYDEILSMSRDPAYQGSVIDVSTTDPNTVKSYFSKIDSGWPQNTAATIKFNGN